MRRLDATLESEGGVGRGGRLVVFSISTAGSRVSNKDYRVYVRYGADVVPYRGLWRGLKTILQEDRGADVYLLRKTMEKGGQPTATLRCTKSREDETRWKREHQL